MTGESGQKTFRKMVYMQRFKRLQPQHSTPQRYTRFDYEVKQACYLSRLSFDLNPCLSLYFIRFQL